MGAGEAQTPAPISIHAPRTGSDPPRGGRTRRRNGISIHAPRTGSDSPITGLYTISVISIHAPRTGSDHGRGGKAPHGRDFNPRSPHGERRRRTPRPMSAGRDFNPRSPHGERPSGRPREPDRFSFQSTLPARGATRGRGACAPRRQFQSTLPARGATRLELRHNDGVTISIHAPRTGSDTRLPTVTVPTTISIHAPRTGSDSIGLYYNVSLDPISIHAPRTGSDLHKMSM